jgi:hypothetical protein
MGYLRRARMLSEGDEGAMGGEEPEEEYELLREVEERQRRKSRRRGPYRKSWSGPA